MKKPLLLFLFIFPLFVFSQNTTYFMEYLPQTNRYNPAVIPESEFYLNLPGMGGITFGAYNSGFTYDELEHFTDNIGDSSYDPDGFIRSIGSTNKTFASATANLLSFGFPIRETDYISFSTRVNSAASLKAPSNVVYLADPDALAQDHFPLSVENMDLILNNYISLGITYSRKINERLLVGITPNINFNLFGLQSTDLKYTVSREELPYGDYEYETDIVGEVLLGMPTQLNPEATDGDELDLDDGLFPESWDSEYGLSEAMRNKSLSVDIGAIYSWREFTFSASILNIGASNWKTNGYRLKGDNESIRVKDVEKIKIGIPPEIYLGGKHQFSPKWNYGFIFHNTFYKRFSDTSATLSLNGYVGKALSTSVSYTAGYRFNNIGLGLRIRFLPGTDLFLVTDNVIQLFTYKNSQRATAAFGINLVFGNRKEGV